MAFFYSTLFRPLFLAALLSMASLLSAQAQLNYTAVGANNTAGTYIDLGATGTAIATTNTDDANSAVQNIGFIFSYNALNFTHFTLNTNGFIKLGSTAPSDTKLFNSEIDTTQIDVFQSSNDPNIIAPLNIDLTAGSVGGTEYRVATTGTQGSRICTIQWKNVADKAATSPTQYANMSFQVRLYETTGAIEFVYAAPTRGSVSTSRLAQAGLKGSAFAVGQLVQPVKFEADAWSAAVFYTAAEVLVTNYLSPLVINAATPPDAGRTFRFNAVAPCPTTPAIVSTFPYAENFNGVDALTLPCGITTVDVNQDNNSWILLNNTIDDYYGFPPANSAPNAMQYLFSETQPGNDWFFTPPLALKAGMRYQLQFSYSAGDASYPEALEVKAGIAATPTGQTITLFSNASITNTSYVTTGKEVATLAPTVDGTYYLGFHAISKADMFVLSVDDLRVTASSALATRGANTDVFSVQAAPVPFGAAGLSLTLNTLKSGPAALTLSDALGRAVRTAAAKVPAGSSTVTLPEIGSLAAGVYFLTVQQGGATQVIRVAHE
jgi:hypothetical protein